MPTDVSTNNKYLSGAYAPVHTEETLTDLTVTGTLPDVLDGRYLRNGPNPIGAVDPATYHWFTGAGMVHGIRLRDGAAEWYRNRWVRSRSVAEALGEAARPGPIHDDFDFATNTNVFGHAGRTFAVVEAGSNPYELTDELDTIGPCDFDGTLGGGYTAHPHPDPATGELHAISYYFGWGNKVRYSVLGVDGRVNRLVDVETAGAPMLHDCALTDRSIVVYDLPVTFSFDALSDGASFPYRWNPDYVPRLGVLPRDGESDDVQWFEVDPCYVFHTLNAYEDDDRVVLDVVRHPKMFDTRLLGPDEGTPTLTRWTLDRASGTVASTTLDGRGQEFPRIDERRTGLPHRFGYAVGVAEGGAGRADFADAVLRHDLVTGSSTSRRFGPASSVGEFVFVPASDDAEEDDGYLMGLSHDAHADRSRLEVLDAATLESVAAVELPVRIPVGFHGNWVPTA